MATFITRLDGTGTGLRLAVKDLIDMEGVPTTAGCRAVADRAEPAKADAPLLAGARDAGVRIVGKTNLHELAFGVSGINPWFGTPVNPLDPGLVPGGSSSGSAVAVAVDDADVALGSDTGGSIRIPAACCGIAGLKTTWGRVSLDGVWPLAPSLDTVGPIARDVRGVIAGMTLLEPGFGVDPIAPNTVGRLRLDANPAIDDAIDRALAEADFEVADVEVEGWVAAGVAAVHVLQFEAWATNADLVHERPDGIGRDVLDRLRGGTEVTDADVREARAAQGAWQAELQRLFDRVEVLALPTLADFPPALDNPEHVHAIRCTLPVNLAGVPALALPVPTGDHLPASLQLVGPANSEEQLLAAGLRVEQALA